MCAPGFVDAERAQLNETPFPGGHRHASQCIGHIEEAGVPTFVTTEATRSLSTAAHPSLSYTQGVLAGVLPIKGQEKGCRTLPLLLCVQSECFILFLWSPPSLARSGHLPKQRAHIPGVRAAIEE